jgi:hypothetical protein
MGEDGTTQYNKILKSVPSPRVLSGWKKGYALSETAKLYGITDPKCMILCDDDPNYIDGVLAFNPNFTIVCGGKGCGGKLTISSVGAGLDKCQNLSERI